MSTRSHQKHRLRVSAVVLTILASLTAAHSAAAAPPLSANAASVTATVPLDWNPGLLAVNQATGEVYAAVTLGSVAIIDPISATTVARVGVGDLPLGVAVNSRTNRAYVTNVFSNTVTVIDGATRTVVATVAVGIHPRTITVNEVTNRVYVANQNPGFVGTISVIDGNTNTLETTYGVPRAPEGIAINPLTNRLYMSDAFGTLSVMDAATGVMIAFFPVGPQIPFSTPYFLVGVDVNPVTNRVYVSNMATDRVIVVDGVANRVLTTIPVGSDPQGIALNPLTNRVYVANMASNDLSIIDGSTNAVAETVVVGVQPVGVAVDPRRNRSYVTNTYSHTVSIITESDTTAPSIAAAIAPAPNAAGWNRSDVNVTWDVADDGSGIASSTGCGPTMLAGETAGTALTCTATNGAGLTRSESVTVMIDKTAPQIVANATTSGGDAYAAGSWTNQTVTVHYTCSDSLSGVASCALDQTISNDGTIDELTGEAADAAGNRSTASFGPIRIDQTPPTIVFIGNNGTYAVDELILITCAARDSGSGIATTTCPAVASGPATDFFETNPTIATATALDNAGNRTTATSTFTVNVTADGICRLAARVSLDRAICIHINLIAAEQNPTVKQRQIDALDNFLAAQSGKGIPSDFAALLSRLARLI